MLTASIFATAALLLTKLDAPPVLSGPVFSFATRDAVRRPAHGVLNGSMGNQSAPFLPRMTLPSPASLMRAPPPTRQAGRTNMNLMTYVTPVGIRPDRLWAISLFRKTSTHANFAARRTGVLQQLTTAHAPLTHTLGGTSASTPGVDKAAACADAGFAWSRGEEGTLGDARLLPGCYSYVRLTMQGELIDAGEHDVAICRVDEVPETIIYQSIDSFDQLIDRSIDLCICICLSLYIYVCIYIYTCIYIYEYIRLTCTCDMTHLYVWHDTAKGPCKRRC